MHFNSKKQQNHSFQKYQNVLNNACELSNSSFNNDDIIIANSKAISEEDIRVEYLR